MLLALWWAFNKTTVRSDLSLFLPSGATPVERLLLNELNEGPATRLLLLAITGGSEDERVAASRELAKKLKQSELFSRVENGTPSLSAINQKPLFSYRYLLSSNIDQDAFTTERLKQALTQRLQELRSPLPSPFKQLLPADPTGEYQALLRQWLPESRPHLTQGVWSSEDGSRTILVAETHASGFAIDQQQQAVEMIQDSFQASDNSARLNLIISGPGAFGIQSRSLIQSETRSLSLLASASVTLLLFIAYRSKRYLILAIIPLASAFLAGIVTTSLLFNELHGITLAFGITLLGVTIDYPLHLFSHLREGESAASAVQRIWGTLRLGVITTCIGYLVLITTDFTGLQQLGVFTIAGLFAAALSSRLILPLLIPHDGPTVGLTGMQLLASLPQPTPTLARLILVMGLLMAISLLFSPTSIWQDDIGTLTPLSAEMIKRDRELRGQLRAPEPNQLVIIKGDELETTLQTAERLTKLLQPLVKQGVIGGFDSASRYLPSIQTQQARRAALPSREIIESRLNVALAGLPFRQDGFTAFVTSLDETRQLTPLTYDDLANTPPGMRLTALLRKQQAGWLLITPLSQVNDGGVVADLLRKHLPSAQYLNLRTETSRLVTGFRHQINERLVLGGGVMLLVLIVGLKSFTRALKTVLPVILALLITAALLHLAGVALSLFHLVSLMLVLGIGIDYSLFFGRSEDDGLERTHTLHALVVCALSTSLVFGILGSSDLPVLRAIGQTVAIGVVISFLTTFALARTRTRVQPSG
jgi:predicted exporter